MFCFKSIIIFFCLLNFNFLFSSDNLLNSGFFDFNLSEKTDIKNGNIAIINGSVADLYVQSPEKVDLEVLKMYSSSNNRLIYRSAQAIYGEIVIVENEDENKKYVKIFHPFHFYIDSSGKMNNCFYIKSEKLNKLDDAIKNKYLEAFNSKKK